MTIERHARLFRNGRNQALRIPRELEFPGEEVIISREGDALIVRPALRRASVRSLLAGWDRLDEPLSDVDEGALPLDDVQL